MANLSQISTNRGESEPPRQHSPRTLDVPTLTGIPWGFLARRRDAYLSSFGYPDAGLCRDSECDVGVEVVGFESDLRRDQGGDQVVSHGVF